MPPRVFSDEQVEEIVRLYRSGLNTVEIGRLFGGKQTVVHRTLKRAGVEMRTQSEASARYRVGKNIFETWNPASAYWLGYLLADGSIAKRAKCETYVLRLTTQESDREFLQTFLSDLEADHPIHVRLHRIKSLGKTYPQAVAQIADQAVCASLLRMGLRPLKALNQHFPDVPQKLLHHFVRGNFDGDGSLPKSNKAHRVAFCGSQSFLNRLREVITKECDIETSHVYFNQGLHHLYFGGVPRVRHFLDWLYRDKGHFYLPRKFATASLYLSN